MRTVLCDYCGNPAVLCDSGRVYHGRSYGLIWYCAQDQAWVGVHKNNKAHAPLGRLANAELRRWKQNAHAVFDPLWERAIRKYGSKTKARGRAYAWLAEKLGIPLEQCHIGRFDVAQCKQVVEVCKPYAKGGSHGLS